MLDRKAQKILTLGIFAHANAGKTTITEHLLYHTNIIDQIGRVDSGNTVTDNLKVEQERGITVRDSIVSFALNNKTIQLIDTPGHVDFSAEVERAISVLDGAVLVISGVEGIEAQTYTIWRVLREKKVPVIIFINKMDRQGADYERVVAELQNNLDIPTLTLTHVKQKDDGGLDIINAKFEDVVEEVSMVDDQILNQYVTGKVFDTSEIANKVLELSHNCQIFPVIGGSALNDIGIKDLVEAIGRYIPTTTKVLDKPLAAYVFTIRVDENGKNAYLKILNGDLGLRDTVELAENNTQKVKGLLVAEGTKLFPVDRVYSGDIAVVQGLDLECGQIIGNKAEFANYISFVKPLLTMEINPLQKKDTIELMNALKILNEEDPYLNVRYNERTNSIFCSLMGEVQAQIIKTLLDERFGIKVNIENPIIIHKEVPTIKASARATYTTVSGVGLEVTPLERGSGFRYISKVSTDYLHLKYQRQIERLINYYSKQGLNGWELTDMEVALIDGQFDSMGSEPLHFNIATPLALFRCLKQAKMKLLEPITKFIITAPEKDLSAVIKLLSTKNSTYEIIKHFAEEITLEGEAPAANMMNFPLELSMITSGRGTYASYISRYEISKNQEAQIDIIGPDPRNETTFIINDMKASMEPLDKTLMKKKKESRSKFARQQKEKEHGIKM
ncbi:MAG TPA: TetM/TetW/TetO/TetS family tetracycline resistance ribosomal protection protein [Bacilli bacterium]|nr:TetM/TetW/TetO/TetS family tetracycline resistance ribosomal protection protein [Bacilli bacterium]